MGQFEDTDWFNRLRTNDIGIFCGDIPEEKGTKSEWNSDRGKTNERYYNLKWTENRPYGRLELKQPEVNFSDRKIFVNVYRDRTYKKWNESVLKENLIKFYTLYNKFKQTF